MNWRVFFLAVLLVMCGLPSPVFAATFEPNQAAALAGCQQQVSVTGAGYLPLQVNCQLTTDTRDTNPASGEGLPGYLIVDVYGNWNIYVWNGPMPPTCTEGQLIPNGTTIGVTTAGQGVYQGCCLALILGGPNSGGESETGAVCDQPTGPTKPLAPASETSNPDGSKTWCDTISGKCVTYNPNGGAPASSSSSANNSTNSSSQTNTPASSSSSSSTSSTSGTTSGSGSGGSGSGSYSGTTDTTTSTDNPASSSSTNTKCDTGVCDVGNADGVIGTLYTPSTDTPSSVFAAFRQSVSSSALVSSVTGFFSFSASGACPVYTMAASKYVPAETFDYFCQPGVLSYLQLAGWVVLAVGAFCAFRIAIY